MTDALEIYTEKLAEKNPDLADSVKKSADDAAGLYLNSFSYSGHTAGLLYGQVQSGKTSQMFGIICQAYQSGFPVFILLTTDNVDLQQQTLKRTREELGDSFLICGERDTKAFENNQLSKPTIIVLKKNVRILKLWADIFANTAFLKGNFLFILDDEADAASLNTMISKKSSSAIHHQIKRIRKEPYASLFLEVTGTPEALLLQTKMSGWKPDFIQTFKPGKGYLGGSFFFPEGRKAESITFISEQDNSVFDSVIHHLVVSAQIFLDGGNLSNALYHPGMKTESHKAVADEIRSVLLNLLNDEELLCRKSRQAWENISPARSDKKPFNQILTEIKQLLNGNLKILEINSKSEANSGDFQKGCNFLVGGNVLGRGITVPRLHTVYYSRTSKSPNADTMWQHNRMFGYDRDPGMIQVWMTPHLYKLFSDISAANRSIEAQIARGLDNIHLLFPPGLNPTRKSVIDQSAVELIPGGTNFYPDNPENRDIAELDRILKTFHEDTPSYPVSLNLILHILEQIIPSEDFALEHFVNVLKSILAENPTAQGELVVRRNRSITQGTGALLSPNDWELGKSFSDRPVLTMYKMSDSASGWKQSGIWVPNIKLPDNIVYYAVQDK